MEANACITHRLTNLWTYGGSDTRVYVCALCGANCVLSHRRCGVLETQIVVRKHCTGIVHVDSTRLTIGCRFPAIFEIFRRACYKSLSKMGRKSHSIRISLHQMGICQCLMFPAIGLHGVLKGIAH